MIVLHIAPFDPGGYPPLINTVHVCRAAGIESVILASLPVANQQVLGDARVVAPDHWMRGGAQQGFMATRARTLLDDERPALIIAHNVRALGVATMASLVGRARFVYHCHDFEELEGAKNRVFWSGEVLGASRAAETWVPAPERLVMARERLMFGDVRVVRNCPRRVERLPERGRLRAWLREAGSRSRGEGRLITRHGKIGNVHCIRETIEAMPLLPDDVEFVIIGEGDKAYIEECKELSIRLGLGGRVSFHPFVPHSELGSLLVDADVGMGLYAPSDLNAMTPAPNKVFENMALGVPVVVAEGNSVADDVLTAGAGLAVKVGSREALADALDRLLSEDALAEGCKKAARRAHLEVFNYEKQLEGTVLGELLTRN